MRVPKLRAAGPIQSTKQARTVVDGGSTAALSLPLNLTDRMYLGFFAAVSAALLLRPSRVPDWRLWLLVDVFCLAAVVLLANQRERGPAWTFFHDWYPLAMFIVAFEEVAQLSFLLCNGWQDHYLLAWEQRLFAVPPTVWLARFSSSALTEVLNVGYFSYFVLLMIVGGVLYARRDRRAFRQVMDASVLAYIICYAVFILFPTEGPAHTLAGDHAIILRAGGPFHWAVMLIQKYAGVHGNAFPSSHVAAGVVALIFAWRYARKLGAALTPLVALLCVGAVYDRYHYALDVVAGVVVAAFAFWLIMAREARLLPEAEPSQSSGTQPT